MADIEAQIQLDRIGVLDCSECKAAMDVADLAPFTEVECPVCNHRDTVPARFGQFALLNLINSGGMGAVYRGRDESLGRLVAIKVMLKSLGEDPKVVEDFKREAQAAARLNHPNVAQIYSFGQEHSQPYIVMELVSGKRFDKMIEERKALDAGVVLKVAIDIAEGLKAADEIGLVHGDVKPENILLDERNNAKLVDFGIASFADQAAPEQGGIWGTPFYIAPEKVKRKKSDARSDIYSLGATLYHALSGKPPFDGETPVDVVRARLETTPEPLKKVRPEIPEGLSDAVARMLEMEPARRHPTYASLIGDLRRELDLYTKKRTGSLSPTMMGKRIRIKKSSGASAAGAPAEADSSGDAAPTGKRTVKIAKRTAPGHVVVSTIKQKTPEQIRLERKQKARARAIQATIIGLLLLLIGGGVIGLLAKKSHDQKLALRARDQRLRIARDECEALLGKVKEYGSAVAQTGKRIEPLLETVREVVQFVEGKPLSSFYSTSAKPARAPDSDPDAAPAAVPEDAPAAAPAPSEPTPRKATVDEDGREAPFDSVSREDIDRQRTVRNPDAPAAAPAPSEPAPRKATVDEDGREAPFDSVSREDIDRQRTVRNPDAPAASAASDAPPKADAEEKRSSPDTAAVAAAAPAQTNAMDDVEALIANLDKVREPIEGPEVVVLADQVVIFSERIDDRINEINARILESEGMYEIAESTQDPDVGASQVTNINGQLEFIQKSKDEISQWITDAKEITAKVSQIQMATKARREREAQEAADRAKAEAYADLVKREKEMVVAVNAAGKDSVLNSRFKEAVGAAEALGSSLTTEEAKADLKIVIERYTIVNGVREFLIKEITKTPYQWGWRTAGGGAEDIEAADAEGIKIRSGNVPWKDVSLPALSQIVTHYLKPDAIPPSVKSNQLIGLAVLCRLHERTSAAEQFESKATFASPHAQAIIERVKP